MSGSIQSVQRAVAILRTFSEETPELGVMEISRRLDLHKSTISRILATLQESGLVSQNPQTGKYRLGLGLISLAGVALGRIDLRGFAQPHMTTLLSRVQETITLQVLNGREAVSVERLASHRALRYVGWIGRRTPLHCTAGGRVLLAWLDAETRQGYLSPPLGRYTEKTEVDPKRLAEILAQVKGTGRALVQEEFEADISSLAAPICDHTGQVVAALEIAGPSTRLDDETLSLFTPPLLEATEAISIELGGPPLPPDMGSQI